MYQENMYESKTKRILRLHGRFLLNEVLSLFAEDMEIYQLQNSYFIEKKFHNI